MVAMADRSIEGHVKAATYHWNQRNKYLQQRRSEWDSALYYSRNTACFNLFNCQRQGCQTHAVPLQKSMKQFITFISIVKLFYLLTYWPGCIMGIDW